MQIHRSILALAAVGPLLLGVAFAHAQGAVKSTETTTTTVITSAVPAPKEQVPAPEGYLNCSTVAEGWEGQTWHPEYKVCRYDTTKAEVKGEAWVGGHWQCSQYAADRTQCTNWDWAEGHWVTTLTQVR